MTRRCTRHLRSGQYGRSGMAIFVGSGPGRDRMMPIIKILGKRVTARMRLSGVGRPGHPPVRKKTPREK